MHVRGKVVIADFVAEHREAGKPLGRWVSVVESSQWSNFAQIRATFRSADLVRQNNVNYVIFNVGGNKYRVVTEIDYRGALVVVDVVMTHAEYSRDRWKETL